MIDQHDLAPHELVARQYHTEMLTEYSYLNAAMDKNRFNLELGVREFRISSNGYNKIPRRRYFSTGEIPRNS